MRKILLAAMILMILTAKVEAVPFTRPQLDNIFLNVEQNTDSAIFNLNAETFKDKFNEQIAPILKKAMETDDISQVEYLFLIKDYKIIGKTFANMFGDYRVMITGNLTDGGDFKALKFCFTTPEERDESLFTVLLVSAFVKSIAPDVDPENLMYELTGKDSTGEIVKGNIKFAITSDENLNILTATPIQ